MTEGLQSVEGRGRGGGQIKAVTGRGMVEPEDGLQGGKPMERKGWRRHRTRAENKGGAVV